LVGAINENNALISSKANIVQEDWISPTMLNSWVNYDDGIQYSVCQYMKDEMGFVHFRGLIKSGTVGSATPVFVLPVGYRPDKRLGIVTISNNTVGQIDVFADGKVSAIVGSNVWITLVGIMFRAV
jgi:hypothetical protein